MARSNQNQRTDYAALNAADAKTVNTAIAVIDTSMGTAAAAKYNRVRLTGADLKWQVEKGFVQQIFQRSPMLCKALLASPHSLTVALQSAASLGLTFDPSQSLAFLVPQRPRKGADFEVTLKVSYRGMEQAVLASGTVTAITTELVYSNDVFDYGSNIDGPYLTFKMARGDRGELQGGFCLARYANGERHVEYMSADEFKAVKAAAIAFSSDNSPAWAGPFENEMNKKSIVRRAQKHWPKSPVLAMLSEVYDRSAPMDFKQVQVDHLTGEVTELLGDARIKELHDLLAPELGDEQANTWLLMKSKAEKFESIQDVPVEKFEKFKADLQHRLKVYTEKQQQKKSPPSSEAPE